MSHPDGVDDLEDALFPVDPVDASGVEVGLVQELLDELPQVDVGRGRPVGGRRGLGGRGGDGEGHRGQGTFQIRSFIVCEKKNSSLSRCQQFEIAYFLDTFY